MRALAFLLVLLPACDDFGSFSRVGGPGNAGDAAAPTDALLDGNAAPDIGPSIWRVQTSGTAEELKDVWGTGPDDVWAVGANGLALRRQNGGPWTPVSLGVPQTLWSVWGGGPDVWMAGDGGRMVRFVGGQATAQLMAQQRTLYGGSGKYAVGAMGSIYQEMGPSWQAIPLPAQGNLYGVWAGPSAALAVGAGGLIVKITAIAVIEPSGVGRDLVGVWGDGAGTVIAVGAGGTVLSRGGGTWFPAVNGDTRDLRAVWGAGPANVWAVGDGGAILNSADNGQSWQVITSGTTLALNGVWGSGPNDLYVVGAGGLILHFGG